MYSGKSTYSQKANIISHLFTYMEQLYAKTALTYNTLSFAKWVVYMESTQNKVPYNQITALNGK